MALEYTQEITLDLNSNTAYSVVGAKQNDSNSRLVKVNLTQNGIDYIIEENTVAAFRLRKPDGKSILNNAIIEDNAVYITLTAQSLAAAGRGYADIVLMKNGRILSTVSFILIIMSSPQISSTVTSTNEFGLLTAVVDSATTTINEAQAFGTGMRGDTEVVGDYFNVDDVQGLTDFRLNEETFKNKINEAYGAAAGLSRIFTFMYTAIPNSDSGIWNLIHKEIDGTEITTIDDGEVDVSSYGITYYTVADNALIEISFTNKDIAYENNALYYKNQAQQSWQSLQNMAATAEKIQADEFSVVESYDINDYVWFEGQLYKYLVQHTPGPWNISEVNQEQIVTKTTVDPDPEEAGDEYVNLHFKLPQGPIGNCYFATFDIDTDPNSTTRGQIIMTKPDASELDRMRFAVNANGELTYELT